MPMNADILQGRWKQMIGKLQECYGYSTEQAEKDLDEWEQAHRTGTKVA
jgi:uncharacterized protein YjbJ (UPF0337 family)